MASSKKKSKQKKLKDEIRQKDIALLRKEDVKGIQKLVPDKGYLFVSYSNRAEDAFYVYEVVKRLQSKGVNIYIDTELHQEMGESWVKHVFEKMDSPYCKGILYFISEASMKSPAALLELVHSTCDKRIELGREPLRFLPIAVSTIPASFNSWCEDLQKEASKEVLSDAEKQFVAKAYEKTKRDGSFLAEQVDLSKIKTRADVIAQIQTIRFGKDADEIIRAAFYETKDVYENIKKYLPEIIIPPGLSKKLEATVLPDRAFFGREKQLQKIDKQLAAKNKNECLSIVYGEGGMGKSSVSIQYAINTLRKPDGSKNNAYANGYDRVVMIPYHGSWFETLTNDESVEIANFKYEDFRRESEKNDLKEEARMEKYYAEKLSILTGLVTENTLLIIDNMNHGTDEKFPDIRKLATKCHVVITTRCTFATYDMVVLDKLDGEEKETAFSIFREYYKIEPRPENTNEQLDHIFQSIGYMPLMIEILAKGANIAGLEIAQLHDKIFGEEAWDVKYPTEPVPMMLNSGNTVTKSIYAILREVFKLLDLPDKTPEENEAFHQEQRKIMHCLSLVPFSGIKKEKFGRLCNMQDMTVVQTLIDSGFVRLDVGTAKISLHQVISDVFFNEMEKPAKVCKAFITALEETLLKCNMKDYLEHIPWFHFIRERIKEADTPAYRQYLLTFSDDAKQFSDFLFAKVILKDLTQNGEKDEYYERAEYSLLTILVEEDDLAPAKEKIDELDQEQFEIVKKEPVIQFDFCLNKAWYLINLQPLNVEFLQKGVAICKDLLTDPLYEKEKERLANANYILGVALYKFNVEKYAPKNRGGLTEAEKIVFDAERQNAFAATLLQIQIAIEMLQKCHPDEPGRYLRAWNQAAECEYQLKNYLVALKMHRKLVAKKEEQHYPDTSLTMANAYRNFAKVLMTCHEEGLLESWDELDLVLKRMFATARACEKPHYILMAHDISIRRYLQAKEIALLAEKLAEAMVDRKEISGAIQNLYLERSMERARAFLEENHVFVEEVKTPTLYEMFLQD